jgi:hypothetical protein
VVQAASTCPERPVVLQNFKHQISKKIGMYISCVISHLEIVFPEPNFQFSLFYLVAFVFSVSIFDFNLELLHEAVNLFGPQRGAFDNSVVFCAFQRMAYLLLQKNDLLSPPPFEAMRYNAFASFAFSDM